MVEIKILSTKDKITKFVKENPDICMELNLSELGIIFGVSRERVRQILPHFGGNDRTRFVRARLVQFLEEHPEAVLTKRFGGWSFREIAKEIKSDPSTVSRQLKGLGYPSRTDIYKATKRTPEEQKEYSHNLYVTHKDRHLFLMKRWKEQHKHDESYKAAQIRASKKYDAKVLRQEVCYHCGKEFGFTNRHRVNLEGRLERGAPYYITCGRICSRKYREYSYHV